jgi:hypothetical protein
MDMRNNKGQFVKGMVTWNKGMKGLRYSPDTEFKAGEFVGESHPSWKGGIQITKNDCAYLWDGANKRKRRPRAIWEEHHGTLPDGMVIIHLNGDRYDDSISNLKAITRAELLRLNQNNKISKNVKKNQNN